MYRLALAMQAVQDAMTNGGYISYRVPAAKAAAEGGVAAARRDAAVGGRLRLSSVQKIMVRGILRVSAAQSRHTEPPGLLRNPVVSPCCHAVRCSCSWGVRAHAQHSYTLHTTDALHRLRLPKALDPA